MVKWPRQCTQLSCNIHNLLRNTAWRVTTPRIILIIVILIVDYEASRYCTQKNSVHILELKLRNWPWLHCILKTIIHVGSLPMVYSFKYKWNNLILLKTNVEAFQDWNRFWVGWSSSIAQIQGSLEMRSLRHRNDWGRNSTRMIKFINEPNFSSPLQEFSLLGRSLLSYI